MSANSKIEWTDATWNPVTGCTKISPGCANCYIERTPPFRIGHRQFDEKGTTGVLLHPERIEEPLHWRKPRRVFVNSLSDLFHEQIPAEFIAEVFHTMAKCPQHIFQILTKRPAHMKDFLADLLGVIRSISPDAAPFLANVWLGVSVENQHFADERIPLLLQTPAAVRFISAEPLLGPVDLRKLPHVHALSGDGDYFDALDGRTYFRDGQLSGGFCSGGLNWCIVGGESGPGARPMHPDWARSIRDQCVATGVKFFFKQWGEFLPGQQDGADKVHLNCGYEPIRIGKKKAGRNLDGREWNEFPQ